MAFCTYCGKELQEGEVCNCQESAAAAQEAPAAETAASSEASAAQAAPAGETSGSGATIPSVDTEKLMKSVKETGKSFLNVFLKPATAGREFVANASMTTAICMIAVQALCSSIFASILAARLNSLAEMKIVPGFKAFFLTLMFSIIGAGLLLLLFFVAAAILKVKAYWRQLVALVAVRSVAIAPFIVLSWIVLFINYGWGIALFYGSVLLALAFLLEGVKGIEGMKDNKALYSVFIVLVLFIVIYSIVWSKTLTWYLAKDLREWFSSPTQIFRMF